MLNQISSVCDIHSCVENSSDTSYHKKLQFSLMHHELRQHNKNWENGKKGGWQTRYKLKTPRTKIVRYNSKNPLEQKDRLKKGMQL